MDKIQELFDHVPPNSSFKITRDWIYTFFSAKESDYIVAFQRNDKRQIHFILDSHINNFQPPPRIREAYFFAFGLIPTGMKDGNFSIMEVLSNIDDGTTGTGNVFLVFSSVGALIRKFIKEFSPEMIYFGSKDKKRNELYATLSSKLTTVETEYEYVRENNFYFFINKRMKETTRIKELFDSPVSYTKVNDFQYSFDIKGISEPYNVVFKKRQNEEFTDNLQEEFYMKLVPKKNNFWGGEYEFTLGDKHRQTHTGNASLVISTVGAILKKIIESMNPDYFYFEAANVENSRVRLYEILAKEIHKKYPQYKFIQLNAPYREMDMYLLYKPEVFELKDNY